MTISQYLPFLLPPLLGALIGYITNYIAIRMLFRPLRPWRLLGVRIPLTPGIIPGKRGELAAKMGEMVGDHLLTAADVGRALEKEAIQTELHLAVTARIGTLLDRPVGSLAGLVPGHLRRRFDDLVGLAQGKVGALINTYLASDAFEVRLHTFIREQGEQWLEQNLAGLLTAQRSKELQEHLRHCYSRWLQSPATAALVGRYIDGKTARLLASERPVREHLPEELVEVVLDQVERELPVLIEKFGGMFRDPQFRQQLVKKGQVAIDGFLDSLGGMAGLLTGFIDLKKLYAKIPAFLDRAGDELALWLQQEETQKRLAYMARERANALLDRSIKSYVQNISRENIAGARTFVKEQMVLKLQSEATVDQALILTESAIDRIKDRPFSDLLSNLLPHRGIESGLDGLTQKILKAVRSRQMQATVEKVLMEQSNIWIYEKPLGLLSSRLPVDLRGQLEDGVCRLVEDMLKKEAPRLVETLNVRQMVEDKVNGLNLLQVEDLLMGVMKEQFKYINLFGAILGFFIGCVNLLILTLL